jgi:hypothetical protein
MLYQDNRGKVALTFKEIYLAHNSQRAWHQYPGIFHTDVEKENWLCAEEACVQESDFKPGTSGSCL